MKKTNYNFITLFLMMALFIGNNFSAKSANIDSKTQFGTVYSMDFGKDCWYIELDDSTKIEPVPQLDSMFLQEGLSVKVTYNDNIEILTICQIGRPAKIISIKKLEEPNLCSADFNYTAVKCSSDAHVKCGENTYAFQMLPEEEPEFFYWLFDNTDSVFTENPVYAFEDNYYHTVALVVNYKNGCSAYKEKTIGYANEQCSAAFEHYPIGPLFNSDSTINTVFPSYSVYEFIDISVGNPIGWVWEINGEEKYFTPQIVHQFTQVGIHQVCLTILTADSCTSTYCQEIKVETTDSCQASFWYAPTPNKWDKLISINSIIDSSLLPLPFHNYQYQFYNTSQSKYDHCFWDFGDSTFSNDCNLLHEFKEPGTYNVCLTVSSDNCQNTYCELLTTTPNQPCHAEFEYCQPIMPTEPKYFPDKKGDSTIYHSNRIVAFNNKSEGNLSSWYWNFGDGKTSTEKNPVHRFQNQGIYEVCLTVIGADGCKDNVCQSVNVGHQCEIDLSWEVYYFDCQGYLPSYEFYSTTNSPIRNITWNFDDGYSSNEISPIHVFEDYGEHLVCVSANLYNGCEVSKCQIINEYLDHFDTLYLENCGTSLIEKLNNTNNVQLDKVYPNPANDHITFSIVSPINSKATIYISNIFGAVRFIEENNIISGNNNIEINTLNLESGNYIYKIVTNNNILRGKIMIE